MHVPKHIFWLTLYLWVDPRSVFAAETPVVWQAIKVPSAWEEKANIPGFAWYRCWIQVPAGWQGKEVNLAIEHIGNVHEVFFNGSRIGGGGHFPPAYQNGVELANRYAVLAEALRPAQWNLIAVRVYAQEGSGGFTGLAPVVGTDKEHIDLGGPWEFQIGDNAAWAQAKIDQDRSVAKFLEVKPGPAPAPSGGHKMAARSTPLPPSESARSFTVPEDLEIEQVLAEPLIAQPVFLNFDERGRMWVVEYRQYPAPAGLRVLSKDAHWRAVYDKVPLPPPHGERALDRISIHEDSDGDGTFDRHRVFIDGLNIATSCARGRGGVWVLNPPYLLFYPDRNNDDVPDGDPEVHLEGFGLEDTHSVVNSLRWGPDGWLYAAQGSTVSGRVRRPGETNFVYSEGQNIWRYQPETHRYEVFAEGGGNAFGVEFDNAGQIFSGHNGGDTRGFHYLQGAYLRKGFEKHGELSNPYAFGYFPQMTGTPGERFTHNFILYAGAALPPRYQGKLFGVEPLQGRIVLSEIRPSGSTFETRDLERVVTSQDTWFRPVDIKLGPDGAIYICDWYDRQVTHTRNQEGNLDATTGRIYRLKAKGAAPAKPFDLGSLSSPQLVGMLGHSNQWFRQTALRLLADRKDRTVIPLLRQQLATEGDQGPLEALWGINASEGFDEEIALSALEHGNRQVVIWATRLLGDAGRVSPTIARKLGEAAGDRVMSIVLAQEACTARRLPAEQGLPIVESLLGQKAFANDPRIPLLCWWALESKCETDRAAVLRMFQKSPLWFEPMVERHILERLMRRFAAAGTRKDLLTCAELLDLSPTPEHTRRLMAGFEQAYKGRPMTGLPEELIAAAARHNVGSDAFRLRQQDPATIERALSTIQDGTALKESRLRFIEVLGEVRPPGALDALLTVAEQERDADLRRATFTALLGYDDPRIAAAVTKTYTKDPSDVRSAALTLVSSRVASARAFLGAIEAREIPPASVPLETVRKMILLKDPSLTERLIGLWPLAAAPIQEASSARIQKFVQLIAAAPGDPYRGEDLFKATCSACHKLFAKGGSVGPDLTTYQRSNVENLLVNILNPNAEIREGYENYWVTTKDDQALTGFLVERDENMIVLRGPDGQDVTLPRKQIDTVKPAGMSLMPEGLLDSMGDQQVRDLFSYLRSTQPLPR